MWTLVRTHRVVFFFFSSLFLLLFFLFFFPAVEPVSLNAWQRCAQRERECVGCVVFQCCLPVCGRASKCVHNGAGWHVHSAALLPH